MNIRQIGCYYHYCRNLREKAIELELFKVQNLEESKQLLKEYYKLPFEFYKNQNIFNNIKNTYISKGVKYENFIEYFENQWIPYFINGMLNYHYLNKEQRSNSYIENYNRRIKLKLSKFLFGKNKCKITWPLFLYFIKNEEEDYRKDIYNNEKGLIIKNKKIRKFKKVKQIKKTLKNNEIKNINEDKQVNNMNNNKLWFKWKKIHVDMIAFP